MRNAGCEVAFDDTTNETCIWMTWVCHAMLVVQQWWWWHRGWRPRWRWRVRQRSGSDCINKKYGVCPMQLFHLEQAQRDFHPVQNLLLWTKYMAIYRFSKWRPSAILELFYHHTRPPMKSLLLAAAACQIWCQFDTQIWRYSYLNFSHIWLEMPIQAPKWWSWGTLDP